MDVASLFAAEGLATVLGAVALGTGKKDSEEVQLAPPAGVWGGVVSDHPCRFGGSLEGRISLV